MKNILKAFALAAVLTSCNQRCGDYNDDCAQLCYERCGASGPIVSEVWRAECITRCGLNECNEYLPTSIGYSDGSVVEDAFVDGVFDASVQDSQTADAVEPCGNMCARQCLTDTGHDAQCFQTCLNVYCGGG